MSGHMWAALVVGLVVGGLIGFRAGVWWLPALIGKMETLALRGRIKQYRRRR